MQHSSSARLALRKLEEEAGFKVELSEGCDTVATVATTHHVTVTTRFLESKAM